MYHADTEMQKEGGKENQFYLNSLQTKRENESRSGSCVSFVIILLLLLGLYISSILTMTSVNGMRRLEHTVSELELRLVRIEEVCGTTNKKIEYEDDYGDDSDDGSVSKLPAGTVQDKGVKLLARTLTGSQIQSPANSSDTSTVGLSEGVSILKGRQKRKTGTEGNTRKTGKKEKQKGRRTAAHFHLNMPGSDTQFYQSVKDNLLFPWAANQPKKHLMELPYTFLEDHKGIKVSKRGLYLIYTQVTFHNNAPHNIAAININGQHVAQCTQSTHNGMFANCFTAFVRYLEPNANVQIQSLYRNRQILTRPENTFFGLVKLA